MSREALPYNTDHDGADLVRACLRKKAYPTEGVARLAIDTIRAKSPGADVRPYACRSCGQWHVGGTPRAARPQDGDLAVQVDADRLRARIGLAKPARRNRFGESRSRRRQPRRPRHDPEENE